MTLLAILLAVLMAATAIVLITGIVGFVGGGRFNQRYGNRLMQARVALQFLTVAVLVLLVVLQG